MKIGIDIRNIGKKRTGDEVVFFNLAKNLARIDNRNEYVLFTDIVDTDTLAAIRQDLEISDKPHCQIVSLPTQNRFTWNFWTLPKHLRENLVDIYLTQYITPFFVPKKIKIATIIHDISFKVYPQYIRFSDLFFLNLLLPLSFRRADKIIGVSEFTVQEIEKYYHANPDKIKWIHNATGNNFQAAISTDMIEAVRKKYNLPEKFILYIGTLQPRKNLPTLINAYAKLPSETRTSLKLVIAGGKEKNYDRAINEAIKEYSLASDVFLPGFIDELDKPTLFRASHVFCNPSLYEGFGITILEAMTLGIPTLASEIPPHREVARDSIMFFDPKNTNELSEKLRLISTDGNLRQKLKIGEALQARSFSWEKSAATILEICEKSAQKA